MTEHGKRQALTERQEEVLELVTKMVEGGISPTVAEIGNALGTSRQNAHLHVQTLVRKGYLVIGRKFAARSIELAA